MSANPFFHQRVRYRLYNKDQGESIIQDPEGWQDDDKELARNEEYHGIFTQFSNSLTFVGDGADYIKFVYTFYGINANIRLTRDEANPQTDIWEAKYQGDLDLSTYEIEGGKVKVKFNNAGIEMIIKARESEQVELERTNTMDGAVMAPLSVKTVAINGREILLNTQFDIQQTDNYASIHLSAGDNAGGTDRAQSVGVPLNMFSQSHENAHSVIPQTNGGESQGTTGIMFFAVTAVPRTLHIKMNLDFTTNITSKDDVNHAFYGLFISKYGGGTEYSTITRGVATLLHTDTYGGVDVLGGQAYANPFTGANNNPPKPWSVSWEGDIFVDAGESLALEFYGKANLGSAFHDGTLAVTAQNISGSLKISENSYFQPTQSKFILAYEMANRLLEIMTGSNTALKSDFLGRTDTGYPQDGKGALNGFTHGFWLRGFDRLPESTEEEINSFKQLTTSWKDFIGSLQTVWNIGLGIERSGYREKVVIEELSYFYNRRVTVRLPLAINKAKRSVATKYYYSGLDLGYSKGGEYEEAMGLDEYNAKSTFTTVINRIKNVYSRLSVYRADSYGKEFARRKNKAAYPTEDTRYDTDVFFLDLKRGAGEIFEERVWQDDFSQAPTGTYSPGTATNLRLSPVNILLRHGWVIAAGLTKYASDFIRYGSSTANSALKTKLIGGNEYAENGNIVNAELSRARYIPEFIEFEHELDNDLMQTIQASTMIQGRLIPNVYGLFEFTNEEGEIERGYLINLKPNDSKFKLLIANR